ncbi:Rhs-family protein [Lysobacter capsici AZ78]|uniref:Rhs-family protein n=1 Tax=Lysobacter capsici AZ78 TaxID=1444315 RepID=A0A120AHJ5_9GAMM|nr:Rhs-family protein [Lysobacter capsici AZ78]
MISGNGLGLFNGSASQIGTGLGGGARLGQGKDNQYVNIATGNLLLQSQDEQLLYRGMTIAAQRTYNSRGLLADVGADAWITGFERRVELLSGTLNAAGSVMRRYSGDGSYQDFAFVSADLYRSTTGDGAHDTLNRDGATGTWTWVEGSTRREEQYANHADATLKGRLTRIRDLKSDGVSAATWNVVYDASNRVSEVQAVEGAPQEALIFGYDANGRLSTLSTRINGVVNEQVTYGYDGSGRLSSVLVDLTPADAAGDRDVWDTSNFANNDGYRFHTVYTYVDASSLQLSQVRQSDGTLVSYTYDAQGRVRTLTRGDVNTDDSDGAGQTLTFTYDTANRSTEVADSTGRSWGYVYDAAGQLIEVRSPAVSGVRDLTQYSYDASGNVTRVKAVRGSATLSETVYQYDANGNVLWQWNTVNPASGTAATAVQRTYTATNQLASETVYAGLDADRELAAQAPSGGLTTSYVYDAQDRVRFVIDALGAVHEFEYETVGAGAGQVSKSRQYLGAAYSGAMTLAGLTAWATTSQRAQSTLSESTYNGKGRLSGTKTYSSVDASGNGVENDATEIVQYLYDAHGLLTQRRLMRSSTTAVDDGRDVSHTTTYLYDGMGRVLSEVVTEKVGAGSDQLRRIVSQWTYQDSGASVRMVIEGGTVNDGVTSNDLLRVEVRDKAGQLISVTDSAFSGGAARTVSKNYYDTAGRLRASEDAGGARSYFFYDEEGQLAAQVDETGAVIEFIRDDLGRVIQTKSYATQVDASTWVTAGKVVPATVDEIRPAESADDRALTQSYDALGRLLSEQSGADGAVTLYSYDGAGRLLQTAVQDGAGSARVTRYFYDENGRQTGRLDAEGYLTEHSYDLAGRRVASMAYATATLDEQRATGSLTQLRPASNAADQLTRWFYDGRGNVVGELNAEGYLTQYVFDEARYERAVQSFAKQLTGLNGSESFDFLRASAATGAVRENRRGYDSLGRLSTERNAEGTVTRYSYDAQGRVLRTETAADTSEVREGRLRYNVFGELIGELDGEGSTRVTAGMTEAQLDAVYAQYGVRHSYNNLGQRIESIDAAGNKTWYFYDASGQPTFTVKGVANTSGVANAQGEVTEIRYNAFGEVRDTTAYNGRITLATAGSRDSAATAITTLAYVAASDSRRSITYTNRGQVASTLDAEGSSTRYTYNAFNEQIREERAYGTAAASISDYQYDKRGLLTARTDAVGKAEQRGVSSVYDAFGRVTSATDARGVATTFAYDRLGRQITRNSRVTYNQIATWSTSYDAYGRSLTTTDPSGAVTTYAYDDAARSLTVTTPEGSRVVTVRNRHGQTVTITENITASKTVTRTHLYDRDGRLIESHDGLNNVSRNEYDTRGLLSATVDGSGRRVELHYDAVGRVLKRIEDPAGLALTTVYTYDAQGRQLSVTDASGRVSQQRYDRSGRLTEVAVDPSGLNLRTLYGYDEQGRQITVTDPSGTVVQYDYDALGRRIAEHVDPAGLNLTTSYVYDQNDNLIRRADAAGGVTRYVYDEGNQLIYTTDPVGAITRQWFDAAGRLVSVRTFAATTDTAALTDGMSVGQMDAKLVWRPSDVHQFRVHDKDGRARFVLDNISHTTYSVTETIYDQANRLVGTRRYASVIPVENAILQELYAGRMSPEALLAHAAMPARNDALDQTEYRLYDDAGRVRLTMNGLGHVVSYRYDAGGRVVEEKRYANPLAGASLGATQVAILAGNADVATVLSAIPAGQDPVTYRIYDGAGRVRFTIDAIGAVQEVFLDGAGRTVGSRAYANALSIPEPLLGKIRSGDRSAQADLIAQIATAQLADEARDVQEYAIFDSAGRKRYAVDAAGYVTKYSYDAAGRVTAVYPGIALVKSKEADNGPFHGLTGTIPSNGIARFEPGFKSRILAGTATIAEFDAIGPEKYVWDEGASTYVFRNSWEHAEAERVTANIYDAAGRLRYQVLGRQLVELRYDGSGRTIEEIAYGVEFYPFDGTAADCAEAIRFAGGDQPENQRRTRYVYDGAGQLRFTVNPLGSVTEQRYDGVGRMIEKRSYGAAIAAGTVMSESEVATAIASQADVRATRTAYDGAGRALTITDAFGHAERFAYDALGQLSSYVNRNNATWSYAYDPAGRRVAETGPQVQIATADAQGNVSITTRSIVTRTAYDTLGNVVSRIQDADTAEACITRYEYDNRGHQIRTIFPDAGQIDPSTGELNATGVGATIEVTYDALGRAVMQKDVRGYYSYKIYGRNGLVSWEIDQEGYVTGYAYNGFGEQTHLTRYAGRLDLPAGQPVSSEQIGAKITGISVYGMDRMLETVYDSSGRVADIYEYSAIDNEWGRYAHRFGAKYKRYNSFGDLINEQTLIDNLYDRSVPEHRYIRNRNFVKTASTDHFYDAAGHRIMTVDPESYATQWEYNARGEVVLQVEYAKRVVWPDYEIGQYEYGQPTLTSADADSGYDRRTEYVYDALGRRIAETRQVHYQSIDGAVGVRALVVANGYDNEGRVVSVNADGQVTQTVYDALGRVVSVKEPERTVLKSDALAQLASVSVNLADASLYEQVSPYSTMVYDAFGNVVQLRRYANGLRNGEVAAQASSRDVLHTTRYDRQGRSVWEKDAAGTVYTRQYDAADNLVLACSWLDGSDGRAARVVTETAYDRNGRQITSKVSRELFHNGVSLQQIVVDTSEQVRYNAFGEIIAKDSRLDAALATSEFAAQFTYDMQGNMISSNADGGVVHTYSYDRVGKLKLDQNEIIVYQASNNSPQLDYASRVSIYDALGRVTGRSETPLGWEGLTDERLGYDRWGNITEFGGRDTVTRSRYDEANQLIWRSAPEVSVVHADGSETIERPEQTWYYDAQGRLIASRDANGSLRQQAYDAAGQLIASTDGVGHTTRHAYDALGRQLLSQDALGYLTFREFDAAGRIVGQGDYLIDSNGTTRNRQLRESYRLNQRGDRLTVTDAAGQSASYDYDSRGLLIRSRTAAGVTVSYGYDTQGKKIRETNALSDSTLVGGNAERRSRVDEDGEIVFLDEQTWKYDFLGRLIDHNDLSGADYDYEYHAQTGQLVALHSHWAPQNRQVSTPIVDSASDGVPWREWRDNGELSGGEMPPANAGSASRHFEYDGDGRLWVVREGDDWFRYTYDYQGNRTSEESYTRDGAGRRVHMITRATYDAHNRIVNVTQDELGEVLSNGSPPPNGGFESGDAGWIKGDGWTIRQGEGGVGAYDGGWLAEYEHEGDLHHLVAHSTLLNTARVRVQPGQSISASAMVAFAGSDGNISATLKFMWYDANGMPLGESTSDQAVTNEASGTWERVTINATAPSGAAIMIVRIDSFCVGSGKFVVDDLRWDYQDISGEDAETTGRRVLDVSYGYDAVGNRRKVVARTDYGDPNLSQADRHGLYNGGFEHGGTNWELENGWSIAPIEGEDRPYEGGFSAKYNLSGPGGRITYDKLLAVRPGETIALSAMVQQGASSSGEAGAGVFLQWFDANGNPTGDIARGNMVTSGGWLPSTLVATAPPGAAYMKIGGVAYRNSGNDPLWMDEFRWSFSAPNGEFFAGDTGWTNKEHGWSVVGYDAGNGATEYSAQFGSNGSGRIYNDEPAQVREGDWVTASAWVLLNSGDTGGGVFVHFLDDNGQVVGVGRGEMIESGSGWRESRMKPVKVPPGATQMQIGGVAYRTGGSGVVKMDHFSWQYDRDGLAGEPSQGNAPYNAPEAVKTYWYDYDAENRVTLANGKLVNGQVVLGNADVSYALAYDAAGRTVYRRFLQGQQVMQEATQYDQRGQRQLVFMAQPLGGGALVALKEQFVYDDLGRVIERREYYDADDQRRDIQVGGWIRHAETYEYDADGRLLRQNSYGRPLLWTPDLNQSQAARIDRYALSLISQVDYARYGYDVAGRSRGYAFVSHALEDSSGALPNDPVGYTQYYTYEYEARESYLEAAVYGTSSNPDFRPTTTYSQYDGWGRRVAIREHTPKQSNTPQVDDKLRYFAYDNDGNILRRSEGHMDDGVFAQSAPESGRTQTYAYINGQHIASGTFSGQVDLLGRLTAYQSSEAGDMRVPVQAGDTLRRIAGRVYGNENLWYVLASANALEGADTALTAGTTINVPDVKVTANDANTFKPFNPSEAIGSTTPNLPYIEPPPKNHCNAVAAVLAVVIVAVAYVFAPYIGQVVQSVLGTGALATGVTAGAATVAASTVVRGAASAIGVASFSWRDVTVDGITAGVTAGAGAYLAGTATFGKVAADGSRVLNNAGRVAQGMASYGGTVVANATVGRDTYFSWKGLAATAAGAYLGAKLNPSGSLPITDGSNGFERFANDFAGSALDGAINATARRLMGLGKQNWGQIAVDAFGNAIGNAIIGGLQARQVEQKLLDGFTPDQVRAYKQFKAQGEADGMTAASILRNMRGDIPIEDQVGLIRRTLEMSQADPGIFDSDYRRGMAQEYLGMIRGDGGAALSQQDIGRAIRLLEENGAFRLGVPEVIVRQQELIEVDAAVMSAPFESLVDSAADLESELRARREQEHPALLNQKIDAAAQGVGKVVIGMGRAIERAPVLKYGLVAMDVASGPAMYLVREGLAATPVGSWIEAGQERAVGAVSNRFEERPGYSRADAGNAAVGTISVGGMTFFGATGLLKRLPVIERLLAKLPSAKFSDDMRVESAGDGYTSRAKGTSLDHDRTPSPALKGDPYHPDSVAARIKPPYKANPAHDERSRLFDHRKTPEPLDAAIVYTNSIRGGMGTWYGRGAEGKIYQFFDDNAGKVHFSGIINQAKVPNEVLKQLGK